MDTSTESPPSGSCLSAILGSSGHRSFFCQTFARFLVPLTGLYNNIVFLGTRVPEKLMWALKQFIVVPQVHLRFMIILPPFIVSSWRWQGCPVWLLLFPWNTVSGLADSGVEWTKESSMDQMNRMLTDSKKFKVHSKITFLQKALLLGTFRFSYYLFAFRRCNTNILIDPTMRTCIVVW